MCRSVFLFSFFAATQPGEAGLHEYILWKDKILIF